MAGTRDDTLNMVEFHKELSCRVRLPGTGAGRLASHEFVEGSKHLSKGAIFLSKTPWLKLE